ncbi:MAG TPA: ATP synthase subunit I [Smithellaceae bacterium]|nr:ATP synthase subunit I [Smithellaceae bacterium]
MTSWIQNLDYAMLAAAFAAGLALGGFYFTALWQTVKKLSTARHPARLMVTSLLVRLAVLLAGLYIVMAGQWERLAAAMLGFLIIRKLLTVRLGPSKQEPAV